MSADSTSGKSEMTEKAARLRCIADHYVWEPGWQSHSQNNNNIANDFNNCTTVIWLSYHLHQPVLKCPLRTVYDSGHTVRNSNIYWSILKHGERSYCMMFIRFNHAPSCHIKCGTLPADFVLVCNFLMYALPLCYWQKCPESDQRMLFSSSVRAMKTGSVTLIIFKRFSALLREPRIASQQVPHPTPRGV